MQIPLVQAFANIIPALVNTSTRNVGTMQTSVPQMQTRPQCECNTQKPGIPIQAEHICNLNTSNEQKSVTKEQGVHKLRLCDQGVCDQGGFGQCASQRRGPSSCEDGWPSGVVVPDEESCELPENVRDVVSAGQALRRRCRSH